MDEFLDISLLNNSLYSANTSGVSDIEIEYITPDGTDSGFVATLNAAIGTYQPLGVTVIYNDGTSNFGIYPDFAWITAAIFALVGVYSIFRLIGVFFNSSSLWK